LTASALVNTNLTGKKKNHTIDLLEEDVCGLGRREGEGFRGKGDTGKGLTNLRVLKEGRTSTWSDKGSSQIA